MNFLKYLALVGLMMAWTKVEGASPTSSTSGSRARPSRPSATSTNDPSNLPPAPSNDVVAARVVGIGKPPKKGSRGQKRLMAERAAIVHAYNEMADVIAYFDEKKMLRHRRTSLVMPDGFIRNAKIVEIQYWPDGMVQVYLEAEIPIKPVKNSSFAIKPKIPNQPPGEPEEVKKPQKIVTEGEWMNIVSEMNQKK